MKSWGCQVPGIKAYAYQHMLCGEPVISCRPTSWHGSLLFRLRMLDGCRDSMIYLHKSLGLSPPIICSIMVRVRCKKEWSKLMQGRQRCPDIQTQYGSSCENLELHMSHNARDSIFCQILQPGKCPHLNTLHSQFVTQAYCYW